MTGSGRGSVKSVKARQNHVKSALNVIEQTASERGLSADDIISLVNVAAVSKLRKFELNA